MRRDALPDTRFAGRFAEREPQCMATDRASAIAGWAEPTPVAMCLPEAPQLGEDGLRQRYAAFLVALADNANKSIDPIDRPNLKRRSLADAKAAGIHEQQGSSGDRAPYAAKDRTRLDVGENVG